MFLIDLFKKHNRCSHDHVSLDSTYSYCPDCGELIENEWFNDIQVNDNDNYMKNSFKQFEEADKNY